MTSNESMYYPKGWKKQLFCSEFPIKKPAKQKVRYYQGSCLYSQRINYY